MLLFKKISIVLLILLFTNKMTAQEFKGGFIGGLSASQLSGDMLGGFNKAGLIIGGFTSHSFSEKISGKLEIVYIQKGSRNPKISNGIHQYSLDYIEIPLILQYKIQPKIYIETGIQVGILVKQKEEDMYGEVDMLRDFNKTDINLCIGLNYELNETWSLISRLSNTFILTPVREHASNTTNGRNKGQSNTVLSFALEYTLK